MIANLLTSPKNGISHILIVALVIPIILSPLISLRLWQLKRHHAKSAALVKLEACLRIFMSLLFIGLILNHMIGHYHEDNLLVLGAAGLLLISQFRSIGRQVIELQFIHAGTLTAILVYTAQFILFSLVGAHVFHHYNYIQFFFMMAITGILIFGYTLLFWAGCTRPYDDARTSNTEGWNDKI